MIRPIPPGKTYDVMALSNEPRLRHEEIVDIFGQYLMWLRNWSITDSRMLVESRDQREQLATLGRQPYDEAAELSDDDRERAVRLAEATIDKFIQLFVRVMSHQGDDFELGTRHAVRFRLILEIVDIESGHVIEEELINRGGERHFADYWGRWLNRHRDK